MASCSKVIVGKLIFNLYTKNKAKTENQFKIFLQKRGVEFSGTIVDFLAHRVGIIDYLNKYDVNHRKNNEEICKEFLDNQKISTKEEFSYNNSNYVFLYSFLESILSVSDLFDQFSENIKFLNTENFHQLIQMVFCRRLFEMNQCFGDNCHSLSI